MTASSVHASPAPSIGPAGYRRRMVASPAALSALSVRIGADREALLTLGDRTTRALAELRAASDEVGVRLDPEPVDHRIEHLAERVERLRRDTLDVAAAVHGADRWVWPGWWVAATGALRWTEDAAELGPEELPGVDRFAEPAAIAALDHVWSASRAWDAAGPKRIERSLAAASAAGRRRLSAVAQAAARLWPRARLASLPGRLADVLRSPAVRRADRVLGRVGGGLGVAVDVVDTAERLADGDRWGAVRSAASATGGIALLAGGPVVMAVGATVVAGVFVYENRAAVAAGARRAWGAARGATGRVADAAAGARAAAELGGEVLDGARRVIGGLF